MKTCILLVLLGGCALAQWPRHTIDASSKGADGVRLADMNGDGLMDIATGWEEGNLVRVYTHPGRARVTEPWPRITVGAVKAPEDAVLVDLDGDGRHDVISSCEGKSDCVYVHWAPKAGGEWKTEPMPITRGKEKWMFALPLQMDGAQGLDLVVGSKGGSAGIGWLQAPANPRALGAWTYHRLYEASWIMSLRAVDLDRDGDEDIVASDRKGGGAKVLWIERPENRVHVIGSVGRENMFLDVADLDGDATPEIIVPRKPREIAILRAGKDMTLPWVETSFSFPEKPYGNAKAVRAGNLDADPELELVITCESANGARIGCFYADRKGDGWRFVDIGGPAGVKFDRIELVDLDEDGDLDVLTCEERDQLGVCWYANPLK